MAPNLQAGNFKIVSRTDGNPSIGILPVRPAFQFVRVGGPIQNWEFRRAGDRKYRLSIGGYRYTGVIDDKVIVSINPEDDLEWEITYHEYQDTYTIALGDDPSRGWTVSNSDDPGDWEVAIRPIISTRSLPPQFLPSQTFVFVRSDSE